MSGAPHWVFRDASAAEAASFATAAPRTPTNDRDRWLVAHDGGTIAARLLLVDRIGAPLPRYWYHVGRVVHAALEPKLYREQQTLLLGNDLTGAAELRELHGGHDALVALIRHATSLLAPGTTVIAELPGLRDSADQSPFWLGLGRHFYAADLRDALARHGPSWKSHVAALLPRQMIYTSFLPEAARAAIGASHPNAAPLRAALEAAGLRWRSHIAIDDGGPVLEGEAA